MILCYELPIRFPQDTEAPQNVTLIMLFSLKVDEYNHSCAGSESNDTTTIKTQAFVLSGAGGTTSASIVNLAVASPTDVKPVGNVIMLQKNNPRKSPK